MWECLEKAYIQATKPINFFRGLGKTSYPTLIQFINALMIFNIRKEEEKVSQQNHNMVLSIQKGRGNINSKKMDFKPAGQETSSQNCQYRPDSRTIEVLKVKKGKE